MKEYGFFALINHGIPTEIMTKYKTEKSDL